MGSKWCLGKVNIETPIYEKMKFSAMKLRRSKKCFVDCFDSLERLL